MSSQLCSPTSNKNWGRLQEGYICCSMFDSKKTHFSRRSFIVSIPCDTLWYSVRNLGVTWFFISMFDIIILFTRERILTGSRKPIAQASLGWDVTCELFIQQYKINSKFIILKEFCNHIHCSFSWAKKLLFNDYHWTNAYRWVIISTRREGISKLRSWIEMLECLP